MTRKTYMIKLLEWKQFKDVALATYPLELIEYTIYFRQDGSFSRLHYEEDGGDNGYLEATDIEDAKVQLNSIPCTEYTMKLSNRKRFPAGWI